MQLTKKLITAFVNAESQILKKDFVPYLELKSLFQNQTPQSRDQFREIFIKYYGLNVGGLTDTFKDEFFKILFGGNVIIKGLPDFNTILNRLFVIPRKQGDYAMPFSFVSKLVAMHSEKSPIYDRHVLAFFGEKAPDSNISIQNRINWFENFLNQTATDYETWAQDKQIIPILNKLKKRDSRLSQCDDLRLIDFLVWKIGNKKLLNNNEI